MKKPSRLLNALRKGLAAPVTLGTTRKYTAPAPAIPPQQGRVAERSTQVVCAGSVTQIISGSEFSDGKQRVEIRIEDACAESRLRLINTEGLRLDDVVILTVTANNDEKYSQPLAVGMREATSG